MANQVKFVTRLIKYNVHNTQGHYPIIRYYGAFIIYDVLELASFKKRPSYSQCLNLCDPKDCS